jgi:uncharacterized protein (DUF1778 family)
MKNVKAPKDGNINIRCTLKQKALLEDIAAREGLGVSTWLLHVGLRAAQERQSAGEKIR